MYGKKLCCTRRKNKINGRVESVEKLCDDLQTVNGNGMQETSDNLEKASGVRCY